LKDLPVAERAEHSRVSATNRPKKKITISEIFTRRPLVTGVPGKKQVGQAENVNGPKLGIGRQKCS